jgi:hypothetical protein
MLRKVARAAEVKPYLADRRQGDPDDVTLHALRHFVARSSVDWRNQEY